jgi:hypothetical protein
METWKMNVENLDIMKRGEKSLAVRAKQYISICCKTLCQREVVEEYIQELEWEIADLKKYVAELEEAVQ